MRVAKQHIHMGEIFRCSGLAPMQRYLLMAIADYGLPAWPSQARLANKTGLSRSSINTMVSELRRLGVLTTEGRGKSLTYRIDLSGKGEVSSAATPHLSSTATPPVVHSDSRCRPQRQGSELSKELPHEPSQSAVETAGGWEVTGDVMQAIERHDPRAQGDLPGQRRVVRRRLEELGIKDGDARGAWQLLIRSWASTGRRPYDRLVDLTDRLQGARDPRAVILARIREVA